MEIFSYCIQCKDKISGQTGDFVFSENKPFEAISPVFNHLQDLFPWINQNGFKQETYFENKYTPFRLIKQI